MEAVQGNLLDYVCEYHKEDYVILRMKHDEGTTLGDPVVDFRDLPMQRVVAEIKVSDLEVVITTGESFVQMLDDGKKVTISKLVAEDMCQEYKEAHFDEYEYEEEMVERFDGIMECIQDGIRERLDDNRINSVQVAKWSAKWMKILVDMEDLVNQEDGAREE